MNEFEFKSDAVPSLRSQTGSELRTDYGRIVDGVPGCILVADDQGQIVYANRVAVATLGRPMEELLGDGWLTSVDPSSLS
jgi:PAS domain-containing protein